MSKSWPPAQPPEPTYVDDRLNHWADANPDGEAMTYLGRTWTWAQLHERVHRAACALRELGVARGDVVGFLDKNHPACVEISMAAGSIGAANAIVNWRMAGDEIDYVVNDSGAKVLFVGTELMPTIEAIRDRLPQRREDHHGHPGRRRGRRVRGVRRLGDARATTARTWSRTTSA